MGKKTKWISIIQAVGMIISALFFVLAWVSIFVEIPQIRDWRIGILLSFLVFVGFVVWRFINQQNKIRELEDRILKQEQKLQVVNEGLEVYPQPGKKRQGIQIFNSTPNNLSNLKIHLTHLTLTPYFGGKNENYLFKIEPNNYFFNQGERFNKDNGVDKSDYVFVYLAEMQDNKLVFLLNEPFRVEDYEKVSNEPNIENQIAVFEIELLITADDTNNNQLRLATFKGRITYNLCLRWRTQTGKEGLRDMSKPVVEVEVEQFDIQEVKDEQTDQKENPK